MRPFAAAALALLVVLGGCSGSAGNGDGPTPTATPPSGTPSSTPAATGTPTPTPTATPPPGVDPAAVVAFENLSERRQRVFLDALDGTVEFGPNTSYTDVDYDDSQIGVFQRYDYVRYDDRYYRVDVNRGGSYYVAHSLEFVAADPDPGDTVYDAAEMNRAYRGIVADAIPEGAYRGRYRVTYGRWGPQVPPMFRGDSYVRYGNETYAVEHLILETQGYILRVEDLE